MLITQPIEYLGAKNTRHETSTYILVLLRAKEDVNPLTRKSPHHLLENYFAKKPSASCDEQSLIDEDILIDFGEALTNYGCSGIRHRAEYTNPE